MIGKIFITSSGYDPQVGKSIKDPFLGETASMGACRPDIRRTLKRGDHVFVISGLVPELPQFVIGGFEVFEKIDAKTAFLRFPEQRLSMGEDGQLHGNIIVDAEGRQHELDGHDLGDHDKFKRRIANYMVGTNPVALVEDKEISRGRTETLEFLCDLLNKRGDSPFKLLGRAAVKLDEWQVERVRDWLEGLKLRYD